MNRLCILVADASLARLHAFEELAALPGQYAQLRHQEVDLVHPARRIRPCELFSDTRRGSSRAPSGRGFGLSDRRDASLRHMDRRFAADIAGELERLVQQCGCGQVVLAARPHMLGLLREFTKPLIERGIAVHEIDRDLTRLTRAQLQDFLAERGLLPVREPIAALV